MSTETKATPASWMVQDMLAEKERVKQVANQMAANV